MHTAIPIADDQPPAEPQCCPDNLCEHICEYICAGFLGSLALFALALVGVMIWMLRNVATLIIVDLNSEGRIAAR